MRATLQKGNTGILMAFLVLVLIVLTGATVYFWQSYERERALNATKMSTSAEDAPINKESTIDEDTTTVTPPAEKTPVVVYTPNGLFNLTEIAEIKKKFVDPFVDWNNDSSQTTVSITVEKPYPAIAGYQYKISYIFESGGNGGFLYGTTTPLEWWLPECMGNCSFSAEFSTKYPEIIAKMAL